MSLVSGQKNEKILDMEEVGCCKKISSKFSPSLMNSDFITNVIVINIKRINVNCLQDMHKYPNIC